MADEQKVRATNKDDTFKAAASGVMPSEAKKEQPTPQSTQQLQTEKKGTSQIEGAMNGAREIADNLKENILGAIPEGSKKFWENGCHGQPSNLLEAILAIFARLFDGLKDFDPTHPLDFITGDKNNKDSVSNLMKAYNEGNLTFKDREESFLAEDGTVQKYTPISRSGNTPVWIQFGEGGRIQSIIMKEAGSFNVYDYDPKSGNYGKTSVDTSTALYKELEKGNLPEGFNTKTTYEEFLQEYKSQITPGMRDIILYGGQTPDHTVLGKDNKPVTPSEYYYKQLKPVERAFADAISEEGKYDNDKAIKSILENKVSFEGGHVYIDIDGKKTPVREDILRNWYSPFYNATQSYLNDPSGAIYHDSNVVVNIVNYKGQASDIGSFSNDDLKNVEFANKYPEAGLQGRTQNSQIEYAKGLLQQVYNMSEKESEAMVKEVLFKKNDHDAFGNKGLGLAFEKGRAFYVTFQDLENKVNHHQASKDELHAYDEMKKFISDVDVKKQNFENEIGLKLIFSNPRETIRDYLGEGNLTITQVPYASEAKKNLVLQHFLNPTAVDKKTLEQESNGVLSRELGTHIAYGLREQNYDTLTVGSSYKVAIDPKDMPTLNYLLQPGNERELKDFIARLADKHLGGKDISKHLEDIVVRYKEGQWDVKKGDSITFNIDEKGNLSLIFGNDNGVKVDTNQGLDMDELNKRAAQLNRANFENGMQEHTYSNVDYLKDR